MNPIFNMFGQSMQNGPMGNMMNMIQQFNQFRQTYNGNPMQAQQQVQQMLNNGQISQNEFNQKANLARQMMSMMGLHG